jgi:hypothetical protein
MEVQQVGEIDTATDTNCARCERENPDPEADEGSMPVDWEVLTGADGEVTGIVCEDCITAGEQQAMDDEVAMDLGLLSENDDGFRKLGEGA